MGRWDRPDFDFDGAASGGDSHEAGPMRWPTRQGEKFVFGRRTGAGHESGVPARELLVEGQAFHVGAADGDGDTIFRGTGRGAICGNRWRDGDR